MACSGTWIPCYEFRAIVWRFGVICSTASARANRGTFNILDTRTIESSGAVVDCRGVGGASVDLRGLTAELAGRSFAGCIPGLSSPVLWSGRVAPVRA